MIRKIKSEEIPICVEVIKKSFLTVADGYGPLEGMILPPVVNLTFICKYIDGNENVSDESIEVGWFTPNIAKEKITAPDIKKRVCDMLEFDGKQHFSTFENIDSKIKFISDILVKLLYITRRIQNETNNYNRMSGKWENFLC